MQASEQAASPIRSVLIFVCVGGVLLAVGVRLVGAVVVRGRVFEATTAEAAAVKRKGKGTIEAIALLSATAAEARKRAREAHARVKKSGSNPVVVLLIAAIQTAAAVGDITAVARAVPALVLLARRFPRDETEKGKHDGS